jgi:hypothetical protein
MLEAAGATALAGLTAGCIGGMGPGSNDTESPTETASPTETDTPTGTESSTETESPTETDTPTGTDTPQQGGDLGDVDGEVVDTPDGLNVADHELYRTDEGIGARGTVENTGDRAYGYIEVETTLQNDKGGSRYEFVDVNRGDGGSVLDPGDEWEFDVLLQEVQVSDPTGYTVDVDGYATSEANVERDFDRGDSDLEVVSTYFLRTGQEASVVGAIRNVGESDVESMDVTVTLYENETNSLADFTRTVESDTNVERMGPNEVWDFRVEFSDVDLDSVGRYVVAAEANTA